MHNAPLLPAVRFSRTGKIKVHVDPSGHAVVLELVVETEIYEPISGTTIVTAASRLIHLGIDWTCAFAA